ncbi:helix-turn-helix domain-containing protein [Salmonella enterica]|nr:helix-turn-helix domain-containing protein [Salmonella enterica]ECT1737384.1 helix-turn-helix domain-containing protein [Salmonella enterica subsp. enterica serovar Saintpaul]EBB6671718.1 helix-turn-helix domain-containing protein [Salmonella enterica]EBB6988279.1 helix-turn-helix domain-containing protein [Salmonella enterica]EDQ5105900.1 helix-turn-helix domain-containing protein [Salmonella enterica subsp. enterica serovar Saintpaul]
MPSNVIHKFNSSAVPDEASIILWTENNLDKKISISQLADKMGCSQKYLNSYFLHKTGVNISTYIRLRKLTLASFLLRETGKSITDLSVMYGFDYVQSFSRAFKKHFSLSPLKYKESDCWDMSYFFPSAIASNFKYSANEIIMDNLYLSFVRAGKITLPFDYQFLSVLRKGKEAWSGSLRKDCISVIFRQNKTADRICIAGDTVAIKNGKTVVNTYAGVLSDTPTNDAVLIPGGAYVMFVYEGTPDEILLFHAWCKGHGLYKEHCILKRGMTLSIFEKTENTDIYRSRYYIPIVTNHYLAHT